MDGGNLRTMKRSIRGDISPFYVMEVMKAADTRAAEVGDVIHLEVGQPSTSAPSGVIDAAAAALRADRLGYTAATGIPELREAIAGHYRDHYGIDVDPARVIVTAGASGGCVLAFLACFDEGTRVAVSEPGYPCYRNMLEAFGVEVVGIQVGPATNYLVTPELLAAAGPLDGLVVASPANPTGTAFTAPQLARLAGHCESEGIRLISDEIYHRVEYEEASPTAAARPPAVVVQSFSKYYSMTGWRLGWLVVPDELIEPIERLAQNLFISPPTLSQLAAVAAFSCTEELDRNVDRYRANRQVLLEGLAAAGITELAPADGAFYIYADVSHLTDDSQALCRRWLDEIGIAVTPGIDFDRRRGHRFVRFSYSESTEDMTEAMGRLLEWAADGEHAGGREG